MAEQSTSAALSEIVDKIGAGIAEVGEQIAGHAPKAWELVVTGNYAIAVGQIAQGFVLIGVMIGGAYLVRYLVRGGLLAAARPGYHDEGFGWFLCAALTSVVLAVCGGAVFGQLINAHNIAMLIAPEATTARDLLLRAL